MNGKSRVQSSNPAPHGGNSGSNPLRVTNMLDWSSGKTADSQSVVKGSTPLSSTTCAISIMESAHGYGPWFMSVRIIHGAPIYLAVTQRIE